jgi:DNA repair and recombination protein RAD52
MIRRQHSMETVNLAVRTHSPSGTLSFSNSNRCLGDVFDEADFVATTTGNPDEVSLDADTPQQLQRPQVGQQFSSLQQRQQGYQPHPVAPNSAVVTPSKPERPWATGPAPAGHAAHNKKAVRFAPAQTAGSAGNPQATMQGNPTGNNNPSQEFQRPNPSIKAENTATASNLPGANPAPVNNEQNLPKNGPTEASVGFYSARAVEMLRENPRGSPMAPKFDPHAESPSIRKTAGIDHTKSVPVSKPMLFGSSQSPAAPTRNFINPSTDIHRRIGAPGGNNGMASPANKGFTTSSYRPLTRPALDTNTDNNASMAAQDPGLKRPPLNDVTNAPSFSGSIPGGPGDIKRPRLANNGSALNVTPHQHEQQ